ncbi:MAG: hypothetical protein LZF86_90002 [Nitrospira sp.]|nr:MAG: hypothetical protein LZF86_90002 [Nitrospira sp.]
MHDPAHNPVTHPQHNGRRVRHVLQTTVVRKIRTDSETDTALTWLKSALAGTSPTDRPSISLLVRRALKLYRGHISSLLETPQGTKYELLLVRQGSRLPTLRKHL